MGLVDLSYGPFGHPPYGPFGYPLYGPSDYHPNGPATTTSMRRTEAIGRFWLHRTRAMQDPAHVRPRTHLPRTQVNRTRRKAEPFLLPLFSLYPACGSSLAIQRLRPQVFPSRAFRASPSQPVTVLHHH
jgi:hypothetical protein